MALSGTLSDLGIVDLIQFPGTGKKTGELVIAGIDEEARLYYDQGRLRHVICGGHVGMEAMIALVSWEEGEFEFRLGSTSEDVSIEIDLHRALMFALKTRDEKREEARREAMSQQQLEASTQKDIPTIIPNKDDSSSPSENSEVIQQILSETGAKFPYIQYAAVHHRNGSLVCQWARDDVDADIFGKITAGVLGVFGAHPRQILQKVYLTDSAGTCIGSVINQELLLFLAAGDESSLGVISIAASKIATSILESGE